MNNNSAVFKIDGIRILDPDGNEFIPKGSNVNGPNMWWTRDTLQDVGLITDIWKMNCVRLITTFGMNRNPPTVNPMDPIIQAFTSKGVVVMIEMHDYTGGYPDDHDVCETPYNLAYSLEEFTRRWVELAKKYKDNPYVWINIMNEPSGNSDRYTTSWKGDNQSDVDTYYRVHDYIISALRNCGFNNIIVLDENHYGQGNYDPKNPDGNGSAILYCGPKLNQKYDNLLYSLHPYGWSKKGLINKFTLDCHARNLCLIFAEYGAGYGELSTHMSTKELYEAAVPNRIGRLYWSWEGILFNVVNPFQPGIEVGAGYEIDIRDGSKPTNLSWFGDLIWDDCHDRLTLPLPKFDFPILANGDFTNWLHGWWNMTGALTYVENGSHDGSHCGRIRPGFTYTGQSDLNLELFLPNTTYKFSAWGKFVPSEIGDKHNANIGLGYTAIDDGPETAVQFIFDKDEWTYQEAVFTTQDTIVSSRLFVYKNNQDDDFYFDGIKVETIYSA